MAEPVNVVIGGASGMGLAVAQRLAGQGPLLVADRNELLAHEVARELGDGVVAIVVEVTDPDSVARLAAHAGTLGALVHTAGLSPTMARWDDVFRVNFVGTAHVLNAFLPTATQGSVAVCFASIAARRARLDAFIRAALADPFAPDLLERIGTACRRGDDLQDSRVAYSLSKWGVLELVRRATSPWAAQGARVLALSPGVIDTPMGRRELDEQTHVAEMVERTPMKRTGTADEIAGVVEFLCSPAAAYMTGSEVLVDGGHVATLSQR